MVFNSFFFRSRHIHFLNFLRDRYTLRMAVYYYYYYIINRFGYGKFYKFIITAKLFLKPVSFRRR